MPTNGHPSPAALHDLVLNLEFSRTQLLSKMLDGPNRDIDHECGYPSEITAQQYRAMYDREGIAARVVSIYPEECWAEDPSIYETDEADAKTAFEKAIRDIDARTHFLHYLQRVDELSGIGQFGALLIGLDDGRQLVEPAAGFEAKEPASPPAAAKPESLLFLRAFDESLVTIDAFDSDPRSRRYGQPTIYSLTLAEHKDGVPLAQGSTTTAKVHWSRVIHVADNRKSSEVFGVPRMQPVWNRLVDLRKLLGGSAEMFWKGAFPGYAFEIDPSAAAATGLQLDNDEVKAALREEYAAFANSLQRYMATVAVSAKSLAPQVADPSSHIRAQIEALCVTLGVPLRVFLGSERGELASSQDAKAWNGRIARRQARYLEPMLIRPAIDRLVLLGVLPKAKEYFISWPDRETPSELDKANVAKITIEALAKYVAGNVETIFPPMEALTLLFGMGQDEAQAVIDAAEERAAELDAEQEEADLAAAEAMAEQQAQMQAQGQGVNGRQQQTPPGRAARSLLPEDE